MSEYIEKECIISKIDYAEGWPCGSPIMAYEIVKTLVEDCPIADVVERKLSEGLEQNAYEEGYQAGLEDCQNCDYRKEHKRGEWIPFEYGDDTWHKCSVCGVADKYIDKIPRPNGTTGTLTSVRNFCPNCGADMRAERKVFDCESYEDEAEHWAKVYTEQTEDYWESSGVYLQAEQTEPIIDFTPDCPFCVRYGKDECLKTECYHYKTFKQTDSSTERPYDNAWDMYVDEFDDYEPSTDGYITGEDFLKIFDKENK